MLARYTFSLQSTFNTSGRTQNHYAYRPTTVRRHPPECDPRLGAQNGKLTQGYALIGYDRIFGFPALLHTYNQWRHHEYARFFFKRMANLTPEERDAELVGKWEGYGIEIASANELFGPRGSLEWTVGHLDRFVRHYYRVWWTDRNSRSGASEDGGLQRRARRKTRSRKWSKVSICESSSEHLQYR